MQTDYQKDIIIADLQRQIFEQKLNVGTRTMELNLLLKQKQLSVQQILQLITQQQYDNQKLDYDKVDLNKNFIYEKIFKEFVNSKNELNDLKNELSDLSKQNKEQQNKSTEQFNLIEEECSNLDRQVAQNDNLYEQNNMIHQEILNAMKIKQQLSEIYEEKTKINYDLYQGMDNKDQYYQRIYESYKEMLVHQNKLNDYDRDQQIQLKTIIDEDLEIQQKQNDLNDQIIQARQYIEKLNQEIDDLMNIEIYHKNEIEQNEQNILYQNIKIQNQEGLQLIQNQHINELKLNEEQLLIKQNTYQKERQQIMQNKEQFNREIQLMQSDIQELLEYMIMGGYATDLIKNVMRRRDEVNQLLIQSVSPIKNLMDYQLIESTQPFQYFYK